MERARAWTIGKESQTTCHNARPALLTKELGTDDSRALLLVDPSVRFVMSIPSRIDPRHENFAFMPQ